MDIDSEPHILNRIAGPVSLRTQITVHNTGVGRDYNPGSKPRRLVLEIFNDVALSDMGGLRFRGV